MDYSFRIAEKDLFYMHHFLDGKMHTVPFVIPVMRHWLEREIAKWQLKKTIALA